MRVSLALLIAVHGAMAAQPNFLILFVVRLSPIMLPGPLNLERLAPSFIDSITWLHYIHTSISTVDAIICLHTASFIYN